MSAWSNSATSPLPCNAWGLKVLAVPLSTYPHIPMEQYSSHHLSLVVDGAAEADHNICPVP